MGSRATIADLLDPLVDQVRGELEGKDDHHPLVPVMKHLERLADQLRSEEPVLPKLTVLQELGYLKEHSLDESMLDFHRTVEAAIDEAMSPGWE